MVTMCYAIYDNYIHSSIDSNQYPHTFTYVNTQVFIENLIPDSLKGLLSPMESDGRGEANGIPWLWSSQYGCFIGVNHEATMSNIYQTISDRSICTHT